MSQMDRARQFVDTVQHHYGIDWRDVARHVDAGLPTRDLATWARDKYGIPMDQAMRWALTAENFRKSTQGQLSPAQFEAWAQTQNLDASDYAAVREGTAGAAAAQSAADEQGRRRADITAQIQAFVDAMQQAPDMNDPVFAGLTNAGIAAASRNLGASGVRGGLANAAARDASQRASLPYLQQRQGLAAQGLGLLNQRGIGLEQLDQQWANLDLQAQQQNAQQAAQQWAQQQNQAQGVGSAIGGGLGLLGGVAATVATGGAAAPLVPALVSGGAALGGGFGGMGAPQMPRQNFSVNRNAGRPSGFSGY